MTISIEDLYKHMFEEHRFASEYRLKLLGSWGVTYAAFAAAFVWVHSEAPILRSLVTLLAAGFTVIFWVGDRRHRPAVKRPKIIGSQIENLAGIPQDQRFFDTVENGISHSTVIDIFAVLTLILLLGATVLLLVASVYAAITGRKLF